MLLTCLIYVACNQCVWIGVVTRHLRHELLCLVEQPWHHILIKDLFFKSIAKVTDILEIHKRFKLKVPVELLRQGTTHYFLVSNLLCITTTLL